MNKHRSVGEQLAIFSFDLTGLVIEPNTFCTGGDVFNHYANRLVLFITHFKYVNRVLIPAEIPEAHKYFFKEIESAEESESTDMSTDMPDTPDETSSAMPDTMTEEESGDMS